MVPLVAETMPCLCPLLLTQGCSRRVNESMEPKQMLKSLNNSELRDRNQVLRPQAESFHQEVGPPLQIALLQRSTGVCKQTR